MNTILHPSNLIRPAVLVGLLLATVSMTGCATKTARFSPSAVAAYSPAPQVVQPLEALHLARAYVQAHPGTDFMMGSGNSMLPLYKDHTVIITQRVPMADLKAGMTVVYVGQAGFPVAHALVSRTGEEWVAMGVGNTECDQGRVNEDNYIGIVVKAFEPTSSPMLALIQDNSPTGSIAANP